MNDMPTIAPNTTIIMNAGDVLYILLPDNAHLDCRSDSNGKIKITAQPDDQPKSLLQT